MKARDQKKREDIGSRKENVAFFGMYWLALWFSTPFGFHEGDPKLVMMF